MVKKIITFAVGMILVVAFSAMVISYFNTGKRGAENSMAQVNSIMESNSDVMLAQYKQGATITGTELRQLINDKPSAVSILVQTGAMKSATPTPAAAKNYTASLVKSAAKYDQDYINPNKTFECTASTTDGNGNIKSLTFVQK